MDLTDYFDLIIRAGRVPYHVDFDTDGVGYTSGEEGVTRKVVPVAEANCWSSIAKLGRAEGWHLPVFDVDMGPDTPTSALTECQYYEVAEDYQEAYEALLPSGSAGYSTVGELVAHLFDATATRWVPSTTEGHFHVYVDHPMKELDYFHRLFALVTVGVVEDGYFFANAENRGATFVRMPHCQKTQPETVSIAMLPLLEEWDRVMAGVLDDLT